MTKQAEENTVAMEDSDWFYSERLILRWKTPTALDWKIQFDPTLKKLLRHLTEGFSLILRWKTHTYGDWRIQFDPTLKNSYVTWLKDSVWFYTEKLLRTVTEGFSLILHWETPTALDWKIQFDSTLRNSYVTWLKDSVWLSFVLESVPQWSGLCSITITRKKERIKNRGTHTQKLQSLCWEPGAIRGSLL